MENVIVLATGNRHKYVELRQVLGNLPLTLRGLADFSPVPEAVEDGATFDENAYKKAHHYAQAFNVPCLADDTGLAVDALGGQPGVHSARYAGPAATDRANCERLLRELADVDCRAARFVCVLTLAVPNGASLSWEGRCEGEIITEWRGEHGFGYDPLFLIPQLNKTLAEIPLAEKEAYSHRGRALAQFMGEFDRVREWLQRQVAIHPAP
ncbi:MAG: XTP/dITP diphosphatase [Desulfobulbus sp.]|uniref:XTP/dITP diphosphatase n=1 Tax=Desulfobulbus sp. TaxID=895 RepID=UPI00284296BC|nr:XTP/dITP diphosphatase [Desulfobulbus sp.]MDR2550248.1 XTP/dITP diphosphatase [Desulfobulbus sp.]